MVVPTIFLKSRFFLKSGFLKWRFHCTSFILFPCVGTDPSNDKLWIFGGNGGNGILDTSEFLHADGTVSVGPNLLKSESSHCAVQLINSDGTPGNVLYMGGFDFSQASKKVNLYDDSTGTITEDHSTMLFGHAFFSCTIFYSPKHEGRPVVFAGPGGFDDHRAELLDYTMTTTWEESKY